MFQYSISGCLLHFRSTLPFAIISLMRLLMSSQLPNRLNLEALFDHQWPASNETAAYDCENRSPEALENVN